MLGLDGQSYHEGDTDAREGSYSGGIEMKKLFFLGAIVAAIFGARKMMKKEEDEFAPVDDYANAA
jgi:hypothetical protein